ncbi:DUF4123 domain-containing protein [Salinicola endophyticus]|uniref:DUF4123 domain-containing protein n=1 Tax=Salinicola endophyticus TaxID=1949083 RepID=A0AB74U5D7_9GAMM
MTAWLLHDHLNGPLALGDDCEPIGALLPRRRPDLHGLTPHLYRIDKASLETLRAQAQNVSRRGMPPTVCALLWADVEADVLRDQLSRYCLAATPASRWMYCRYFDPRVMTHLRWILAQDQLHSLLGRISRWAFLDASSQWVEIDNEPRAPHWLRLTLDDTQTRRLNELPTLRACLQQWRAHDPQAPRDDRDAGKRVAACLDHGQALGLRDLQDRVALALHELLIHPDIIRHPDIANAIALASGGAAYRHVTGNWPQARWETIQEQLTNRETT